MTSIHRGEAPSRVPSTEVTASGTGAPTAPSADRPRTDAAPREHWQHSNGHSQAESADASTGELVKQLTDQTKTLVKQEMRLAQVELQEKGKRLGIGAGMFGAGGFVAFFAGAALIVASVLALSTALAPWLSALIVGVVLLAVAGGAALKGKKEIEKATPPVPEHTVETVKEDVETVKEKARR